MLTTKLYCRRIATDVCWSNLCQLNTALNIKILLLISDAFQGLEYPWHCMAKDSRDLNIVWVCMALRLAIYNCAILCPVLIEVGACSIAQPSCDRALHLDKDTVLHDKQGEAKLGININVSTLWKHMKHTMQKQSFCFSYSTLCGDRTRARPVLYVPDSPEIPGVSWASYEATCRSMRSTDPVEICDGTWTEIPGMSATCSLRSTEQKNIIQSPRFLQNCCSFVLFYRISWSADR